MDLIVWTLSSMELIVWTQRYGLHSMDLIAWTSHWIVSRKAWSPNGERVDSMPLSERAEDLPLREALWGCDESWSKKRANHNNAPNMQCHSASSQPGKSPHGPRQSEAVHGGRVRSSSRAHTGPSPQQLRCSGPSGIHCDCSRIVHEAAREHMGGCQRGQLLFLDLKGSFFS